MFNNFFTKILPVQHNVDKYGTVKTDQEFKRKLSIF